MKCTNTKLKTDLRHATLINHKGAAMSSVSSDYVKLIDPFVPDESNDFLEIKTSP